MAMYGKQRVDRGEVFFEARQMVTEGRLFEADRLFEEDRNRTERERRIFKKGIKLVTW
jgi:hypothetical protein